MHRHHFEFHANWPMPGGCQHQCTGGLSFCGELPGEAVHAVRGTRYVSAGYYLPEDLTHIRMLFERPPRDEPLITTEESYVPIHPSAEFNKALASNIDYAKYAFRNQDPDGRDHDELDAALVCTGGNDERVIWTLTQHTTVLELLHQIQEHELTYHQHPRH